MSIFSKKHKKELWNKIRFDNFTKTLPVNLKVMIKDFRLGRRSVIRCIFASEYMLTLILCFKIFPSKIPKQIIYEIISKF